MGCSVAHSSPERPARIASYAHQGWCASSGRDLPPRPRSSPPSRRRSHPRERSAREAAMALLLGNIVRRHADRFAGTVEEVRGALPALRHAISLDRDAPDLMARASDTEPEPDPALSERDPHVMLYTSGTTGDPKGALLSHRTYVLQAMQTQAASGLGEDDVGLCMFPMFHMGGWAMPLGYWTNGGTVVLMEKAEPGEILRAVGRERVTYLYLIPTLYNAVLALPEFARTDLSSLRALGSGTSAMSEAQVRTIVERFQNPRLFVMYGQTEAGPVASLRPRDVLR